MNETGSGELCILIADGFTFLTGEFASFMENLVKYKNIVELGKIGKMRHFYL